MKWEGSLGDWGNIAQIWTALVAAVGYGLYLLDRRRRRRALEEYPARADLLAPTLFGCIRAIHKRFTLSEDTRVFIFTRAQGYYAPIRELADAFCNLVRRGAVTRVDGSSCHRHQRRTTRREVVGWWIEYAQP